LSVNVIARIRPGSSSSSSTERTNRSVNTEVLPEPALADSSSGPSRRRIAAACSSVNGSPARPTSRPASS
jgi:hypothetical protein